MRDNLADLVLIWERWTNGDPLLRRVLQASEHGGATVHALVDEASGQLTALARSSTPSDAGLYAALCAGWAVLLALEGAGSKGDAFWHGAVHDAQEAHQDALTGEDASTERKGVRRR